MAEEEEDTKEADGTEAETAHPDPSEILRGEIKETTLSTAFFGPLLDSGLCRFV